MQRLPVFWNFNVLSVTHFTGAIGWMYFFNSIFFMKHSTYQLSLEGESRATADSRAHEDDND